jgi:hypothetical protein
VDAEMSLEIIGTVLHWIGGLMAYTTLEVMFYGIWRGIHRQAGRAIGQTIDWLRSTDFYLLAIALFLAFSIFLWKPLPFSSGMQGLVLVVGVLIYFPGLVFTLWRRLVLGRMYYVSTSLSANCTPTTNW